MKWRLINRTTGKGISKKFESKEDALVHLSVMGESFKNVFIPTPITKSSFLRRALTEGLVSGDLRNILLPQISVDEYIPAETSTDNIVIAFFLKGVPEAVVPFRDFVMRCNGIIDVAYGDSDTIKDTSIVYIELSRDGNFNDISDLIDMVSKLTLMTKDDFSLTLPSKSGRMPYSDELLIDYFDKRSTKKNKKAQDKAIDDDIDETDIIETITGLF